MNKVKEKTVSAVLALLAFAFLIWLSFLMEPLISGQPYNETAIVNTTVNITNSAPIVPTVTLQNPIILTAYFNTTVYCNVTVYDYDNDTVTMNATLFQSTSTPTAPDDQNDHYTNTSCTETGRFDTETNFTCGFNVNYFANNGTWYCNATALDDDAASSNNQSLASTLQPLVAIVIPGIIDYGNLAQGDTSADVALNITNAGNRNSNISVKGWGITDGDGLAMTCTFGNIALQNERYNITAGSTYNLMTQLTGSPVMIPNFFISQRTSESLDSFNATYWQLFIPTGAGGVCNGKILFSASDRGN